MFRDYRIASMTDFPIPPTPSPLVESLFTDLLEPPEGYDYFTHDGQLLWPVLHEDKWRLMLKNRETKLVIPVFLNGNFIRSLAKALEATQKELANAVAELIEEPKVTLQ
jgi:hypothetical protein